MKTWRDIIGPLKSTDSFKNALNFVAQCREEGKVIFPPEKEVFNAFKYTELEKLKVVILGQDPYHEPGQAHGLAFSVRPGVKVPPSLKNIYRELSQDIPGFTIPVHGCLVSWAKQGVLLLNTVLTVESGIANSHKGKGWEDFTDGVIRAINANCENIVFILWGANARSKASLIDRSRHLVLESSHPSPLSAYQGFFGSRPFSKTNNYLHSKGKNPVNWQLPLFVEDSELN